MNDLFLHISRFSSDLYIADYTEYSKTNEAPSVGVCMSVVKPPIEAFYLKNKNEITFDTINFEENKSVFRNKSGRTVQQCECMCLSSKAKNKGWLFLLELKYCREKNVATNAKYALEQLEHTYFFLRDEKNIIDRAKHRVYWIISVPDHSNKAPFDAFILSQEQKLDYKLNLGIIILGENEVEILNEGYIRVCRK